MTKYLYEIYLDSLEQGNLVGTSGNLEFNAETEAKADANNFIVDELSKEYNKPTKDFRVQIYKINE